VILGIDAIGKGKFAVVVLDSGVKKTVSKPKLFRLIKELKPDIVAIDNISELFEEKREIVNFLKNSNVKLIQIAVDGPLPVIAKRFGIKMNPRDPFDEARTCAYLASLDFGYEISVFTDKTRIIVSRNRRLGKGGWRQKRYGRKVHDAVRSVYREIKRILDQAGFEYTEIVKKGFGGISRGELIVNAPIKEIPISPFKTRDVQVKVESIEKEKIELIPVSKSMRYLIVGIDPGTTTAVAIIDLGGNLISVKSQKDWNFSDVVEFIKSHGKPVLIATDKKNPPEFVNKVKAAFNAVLYAPREDLSLDKKRDLTSKYDFLNDHERDALASAIDALKNYESKFRNIEKRLPVGFDVERAKAEIIRGMTLKSLFEPQVVEKVERKDEKEVDFLDLLEKKDKKIKELKEENEMLRKQIEELRAEIEKLRAKIVAMADEEKEKMRREIYAKNLESRIVELIAEIKKKDSEIARLKEKLEILKKMKLLEISGWKEVKLVKKFSKEELEKAEIVEGDIVYIADASGGSKSSAEFLCSKKIKAVITGSEMSHVAREVFDSFGIPRIRKEEVDIIEGSEVAFVGHNFEEVYKSKLEEMRRKAVERIEKLFEDYKKRRI
jgi:predicted RNase H-like nuclease (RuvC/YqgF family)